MARHTLLSVDDLLQVGQEDLKRIWDDLPPLWRDAFAHHRGTPPELLWYAVAVEPGWIDRHGHPDGPIPGELVWDIFLSQAVRLGRIDPRLAEHPSLGADGLSVLADIGGDDVRGKIAGHGNATMEVLARLEDDPARPVRRKAAERLRAGRALRRFFKNVLPSRADENAVSRLGSQEASGGGY